MDLPNVAVRSGQLWTACDGCAFGKIGGVQEVEQKHSVAAQRGTEPREIEACRSSDPKSRPGSSVMCATQDVVPKTALAPSAQTGTTRHDRGLLPGRGRQPAKHALTAESEGRAGSVGLELRHFNRSCDRGKDAGARLTWAWLAAWLRGHGANWENQRLATTE